MFLFIKFYTLSGGMMSFLVKSKTVDSVKCEVIDGGELKSRRHLNVRGKSATLPSITGNCQQSF
jgi:pyruvate kinase